jgi:hypothetical protein
VVGSWRRPARLGTRVGVEGRGAGPRGLQRMYPTKMSAPKSEKTARPPTPKSKNEFMKPQMMRMMRAAKRPPPSQLKSFLVTMTYVVSDTNTDAVRISACSTMRPYPAAMYVAQTTPTVYVMHAVKPPRSARLSGCRSL